MSHLPVPEINKRERDPLTEALIKQAFEEEQQRKKAKKGGFEGAAAVPVKQPKGKTLHEIEEEEGGPVKESMVGMAAVKRAIRRKKAEADDDETALPDDIAVCEEDDEEGADADGDGDTDMFGEDEQQQEQQHRKQWGGRKVPKNLSAAIAAAMESDGGFAVTKFNMNEERQEGNIDAEGNFIPAEADDETAKDAWLNSDEAKPISNKALAAAKAQQAAMDAAEEAPALSETAVAQAQREVASLLMPGESVSEGLRRLATAGGGPAAGKGKALGKREKQRLAQQQQQSKKQQQQQQQQQQEGGTAQAAAAAMDSSAAAAAFTRLTELADLLLNAGGELGIYSQRKEQLERFAKAVLPETDILAAPAGADAGGDDMFADEDDVIPKPGDAKSDGKSDGDAAAAAAAAGSGGSSAAANGDTAAAVGAEHAAAGSAAAAAAAQEAAGVDYSSWPVKELRRFLTERGVDSSSVVEKGDLVNEVKRVAAQGPISSSAAAVTAPAGYNFDRASGYFFNADTGLYWDSKSGAYYNSSEQKWYSWDAAAGQYKELANSSS